MILKFEKYHGAGNDFIIINKDDLSSELSNIAIKILCDRRFGIGADGLLLLNKSDKYDFEMTYYNSDGYEGTMCGNGGRCISYYAFRHKIASTKMTFKAIDGIHNAEILDNKVSLSMNDVSEIIKYEDGYFLDTGSPHFVKFVNNITTLNVPQAGVSLADDLRFAPERTNVNFVEYTKTVSQIATFERGVEDETLACGTGTVASAIAISIEKKLKDNLIKMQAKGGKLEVSFKKENNKFTDIKLIGPAEFVFSGDIPLRILGINNSD